MKRITAIDPGLQNSGWVLLNEHGSPSASGVQRNELIRTFIKTGTLRSDLLAIEPIQPRGGRAVGIDTLNTMLEAGRFIEAWGNDAAVLQVQRSEVKSFLCGSQRANDSNIRQALIDLWGGDRKALGAIKCAVCKGRGLRGRGKQRGPCAECEGSGWEVEPGPLRGITSHAWSALAVAVTAKARLEES